MGRCDAHTASMGAMNALTRSRAVNYQPHVRCNTLVAGPFRTDGLAALLAKPLFEGAFNDVVLTEQIGVPEDIAMAAVLKIAAT